YPFLIPMFDGEWYFIAPFDEYKAQKKIILPAFSGSAMTRYLDVMVLETLELMKTLGDHGQFDAVTTLGPLVMNIASRAFLGEDFRRKLGGEFFDLFNTWAGYIEPRLPGWLPLPRFRRARKAREKLHAMVKNVIEERRKPGSRKEDFLQVLIESKYADGPPLSDLAIVNLILFLVWAGHETTSGQISWALIQLLQNPNYLASVLAEQDALLGNNPHMSMEQSRSLKRMERAIKETERTRPVAYVLLRGTKESVAVGGYTIPAGWDVAFGPAVSQFLPDVFTDPEKWDPERFSPERSEDRRPYSLVGFGGGVHRCLGANFAYLEMRVVLTLLLQRYEFELLDKDPQPAKRASARWPETPTRIRYKLRNPSP